MSRRDQRGAPVLGRVTRPAARPSLHGIMGDRNVTRQPGEGPPQAGTPQAVGEAVANEWTGRVRPFPRKRTRSP